MLQFEASFGATRWNGGAEMDDVVFIEDYKEMCINIIFIIFWWLHKQKKKCKF